MIKEIDWSTLTQGKLTDEDLEKFLGKSSKVTPENMYNLLYTLQYNLRKGRKAGDKKEPTEFWKTRVKDLQRFSEKYMQENKEDKDKVLQGYFDALQEMENKRPEENESEKDLRMGLLKSYGELAYQAGYYPAEFARYQWEGIKKGENIPAPLKDLKLHKTPRKK